MAEHRYDTNWDNDDRTDTGMPFQPGQIAAVLIFVALGVGIAAMLAMMFAPKRKKPGLAGEVEQRVNELEKEIANLSKRIQKQIKELT